MCIIFIHVDPSPDPQRFKLILIMNRDEFFHRPTSLVGWKDGILCGRDLGTASPGGTWCGMDERGRIGALTNLLVGSGKNLKGRGSLIQNFLRGNEHPLHYLNNLARSHIAYKPYNLILLEQNESMGAYQLFFLSQEQDDQSSKRVIGPLQIKQRSLTLSNHPLLEPFIKTKETHNSAEEVCFSFNFVDKKEELVDNLFDILSKDQVHYPDPQIDKQRKDNDFLIKNYKHVGATFVTGVNDLTEGFGTRTQTLILVDFDNNVDVVERTRNVLERKGEWKEYWTEKTEDFKII